MARWLDKQMSADPDFKTIITTFKSVVLVKLCRLKQNYI